MKERLILASIWLVLIVGCLILLAAYPIWAIINPHRAWQIAIAVDDAGNEVIGGKLGTTISSHAAHARRDGKVWGCLLCSLLDWLQHGHCDKALVDHDQNLR